MVRKVGFSILLLLCACTGVAELLDTSAPAPPAWIDSLNVDEVLASASPETRLDIALDESVIWRPGDDVTGLEAQIAKSLEITIDGNKVPGDNIIVLVQFRHPVTVYDEAGNELGSHGGMQHIYVLHELEPGSHVATITLNSTDGDKYFYTWNFEIVGAETILDATPTR